MRFLKDIQEKFKRLKEVESNMQQASVAKDPNALRNLGREMRELQRIQTLHSEFEKIETHILDSEHILADGKSDPDLKAMAELEIKSLRAVRDRTLSDLEALLVKKDPVLQKNAIIEIRAGTGGLEASLFAADVFRMYTRYAVRKGFKAEVLSQAVTEAGGIREVIFLIAGEGVFGRFKFESGVHRVQRVPVTEASGRIHTSAITVAVLPEADPIEVNIKTEDLKIEVFRSGGPGGQSVNTTDSAVRITHIPTGVAVKCQDEKSQLKNKAKAMRILTARIYDQIQSASQDKIAKSRKAQVGSGDRSEKIRTYNFQERRVTDHRIGLTIHNLNGILDGDLDPFIDALREKEDNAV